jgi:SAM-dependent methyltransferase
MAAVEVIRAQLTTNFILNNGDIVKGRVLDVGCGSKPYKRLFPELEWVGLDERPVAEIQADMTAIPCDDDSFDTVLCTDALNFTAYPHKAVAEMVRVLKSGGHLIVVAQTTAPDDSVFFGIHTAGLARMLMDCGCTEVEGDYRNVTLNGLFSRGEAQNAFTNFTWLEGVANNDLERFAAYLDKRYPAICGVCVTKE